jgi:hypothetical protein
MHVRGETLEPADRVGIPVRPDRDVMHAVADVDPRGMRMHHVEAGSSTRSRRANSLRCFRFSPVWRAAAMAVLLS